MGEVYLAQDLKLDRTVALKILLPEIASDPERMKRFDQEARAASALDHPSIAHVYEVGESNDGTRFIAMQYVEGETLHRILTDSKKLGELEAVDLGIQVAEGLAEAHSHGVIHRDIKPANILITPRGTVKVVDFGLAKYSRAIVPDLDPQNTPTEASSPTQSGTVLGTIQYLSPEQASGKQVDGRSDIFSLGCVLFQAITGMLPFEGETYFEMIANILKSEPRSFRGSHVHPQLQRIIKKTLEKDPQKRHQSAADLAAELREFKTHRQSSLMASVRNYRWQRIAPGILALIFLIVLVGLMVPGLLRKSSNEISSIAVLPFLNVTRDPGMEYLSDGITENVISSLSRLPQLKVMARSTVFMYKGKHSDPRDVGNNLNVGAVLTGRMNQQGDRVILQTELVNVEDGSVLWTAEYHRSPDEIINMEEEISRDISHNLRLTLSGEQEKQLQKHYTQNTEAYHYYLKGRYHWSKRTEEGFRSAIESFHRAIEEDPDYALAYAGLADCYTLMPAWAMISPDDGHPRALKAAYKALEIDESLAEAHTALAHTLHIYKWDWKGAGEQYRRAIQLNPNYATAHHWFANYLSDLQQHEQAIREKRKALELDPLSLVVNADLGNLLYLARRYDEALKQLEKTVDLDPNFALAYEFLGYVYEQKGMYAEAEKALQKALQLSPENLEFRADLARASAVAGNRRQAEQILQELLRTSPSRYVVAFDIAMIYTGLGHKDEAFEWLEKAVNERSYQVATLKVDPRVDSLRADPRLQVLLKQVGL